MASQLRHTSLADSIWSIAVPVVPMGKNRSGSVSRQAARSRQSSVSHSIGGAHIRATTPPTGLVRENLHKSTQHVLALRNLRCSYGKPACEHLQAPLTRTFVTEIGDFGHCA